MFSFIKKRHPEATEIPLQSNVSDGSVPPIPDADSAGMDHVEFRRRGKEMIDYIADYLTNIG